MQKPTRHAPRKVPIHLQGTFHEEIRNLEALGILEETKDVTEWVNSFVIMEMLRGVREGRVQFLTFDAIWRGIIV